MNTFDQREWLGEGAFTSTVVTYHGKGEYNDEDLYTFLEIADCRGKIRLHKSNKSYKEFANRLRKLNYMINHFIEFLETLEPETKV